MSRLYLRCAVCDRQQADGLLSGATWARVPIGAITSHPSVKGGVTRVCPWCQNEHADWQARALEAVGVDASGNLRAAG
jgi:hypothetical protein